MKVWKVKSKGHTFTNFVTISCAHSACDYYHFWLINFLFAYLMLRLVWDVQKYHRNLYCLAVCFTLCNIMYLYPVVVLLSLALEQDLLVGPVKIWVTRFHEMLDKFMCCIPPAAQPMLGANSMDYRHQLIEYINDFLQRIKSAMEIDQITHAIWLRPNGANDNPQYLSSRPTVSAKDIKSVVTERVEYYRWLYVTGATTLSFFYFQAPGILITLFFAYLYTKMEVKVRKVVRPITGGPVRNGVYLINVTTLGFTTRYGIGTCFNGVLHVPYHVCYAEEVVVGKARYSPYHISVEEDIVTYNGPPQFTPPSHEDVVFVNCETIESRTTYRVDIDLDTQSDMLTWAGVSKPGESGSPIYVAKGDQLMLAGLAGRYYRNADGEHTEYTELNSMNLANEKYRKHVYHPGYGKTYRIIPQIITNHLLKNPKGKVLVTGPTRVVCMEIAKSLSTNFRVGLMIKDKPALRNEHAQVQIAAHATMLRMLMAKERIVSTPSCLIIDEAHFNDSSTIMLRKYGQHLLTHDAELHEISATIDGQYDDGSNHHIQDEMIRDKDVEKLLTKHLAEGKRVMIFVSSIRHKRVYDICREFGQYQPVLLSRDTFNQVYPKLSDEDYKLIITTDIAECGVNVKGLDVVIDFSKKFDYFLENKILHGLTLPINQASYIQRRGRVGREKQGIYYYMNPPSEYRLTTAAELDAKIKMTGRDWCTGESNPFNLYLTDHQLMTMNKFGETPTMAYLKYRLNGTPMAEYECTVTLESLRHGNEMVNYIGCGKIECNQSCKGNWKWFDERIHDWMTVRGNVTKLIEL